MNTKHAEKLSHTEKINYLIYRET